MNELKRELSRLSGVDFFNPKYRDVFKKYFADDEDAEVERLKEMGIEENEIPEEAKKDVNAEDIKDKVEDVDKAEDEREIDKIEEDKADDKDEADEKKEEVDEESEEIGKDVDELKSEKTDDKIAEDYLDTKIELGLMRAGVREDKIEPAKRIMKYEIKDINDLDRIKEILKDYPEWVRGYKPRDFGMGVDESGDGLTAEEKRLKQMGIDPRD